MTDYSADISMFFSLFVAGLPKLFVCVVGLFVVFIRRKELNGAATWALLGLAFLSLTCVLVPAVQVVVQHWMRETGDYQRSAVIFGALSLLWSVLNAAGTALLIAAVVAGRAKQPAI